MPYGSSLGLEVRDPTNRGNKGGGTCPSNNQLRWICAPVGRDLCCLMVVGTAVVSSLHSHLDSCQLHYFLLLVLSDLALLACKNKVNLDPIRWLCGLFGFFLYHVFTFVA